VASRDSGAPGRVVRDLCRRIWEFSMCSFACRHGRANGSDGGAECHRVALEILERHTGRSGAESPVKLGEPRTPYDV